MPTELTEFVTDFAEGLKIADQKGPQALNSRSGIPFKPGVGPHTESQVVGLVMKELSVLRPIEYGSYSLGVPYPKAPRQKCDLCLGSAPNWEWVIEVKMLRLLGDNGKVNDNILMHILSPYPAHRSAVTDCTKLLDSQFNGRKAILIYGFEHDGWPLIRCIEAFEALARLNVHLGQKCSAAFSGLIHPFHSKGGVFAWEVLN
jgi:hypothetical protein